MPSALWGSWGGGRFIMSAIVDLALLHSRVILQTTSSLPAPQTFNSCPSNFGPQPSNPQPSTSGQRRCSSRRMWRTRTASPGPSGTRRAPPSRSSSSRSRPKPQTYHPQAINLAKVLPKPFSANPNLVRGFARFGFILFIILTCIYTWNGG